ncbi:unnamed protein product [Malus baccata var. baccata]
MATVKWFMTRSSQPVHKHIFDFDDDFERTLRRAKNQQEPQPSQPAPDLEEDKVEEAAQNKTDEFELKSSLLHHIPKFHGLSMEDPNKHLKEFEVVCSSMTPVNVDGNIMKMKAFPFSLLEKAKDWLYELAPGTVTSWESMKRAFLEKFFATSRVILLRKRISGIQQNQGVGQRDKPRQQQVNEVVEKPKEQSVAACGVCSMNGHLTDKCPQLIENGGWESTNVVGFRSQNQPRNDPFSNTSIQVGEIFQISNGGSPNKPKNKVHSGSNLWDSIKGRMHPHNPKHNLSKITQGQENQAKDMHNYAKEVQNQAREVTELKRQIGQMTEFMGQFSREPGMLPSSMDVNPKGGFESAKAITLRSGKEVGSDPSPSKSNQKGDEKMQSEEKEQGLPSTRIEQSLPQPPTHPNSTTKGKLGSNSMTSNSIPTNAPFPRRFMQSKKDESDKDILDTFRKVQVNIPLLDAIKQVPKYAKFLNELCTTRKRASNKKVVNHLVFPADFYVLEMEDLNHSPQLPILLGRPFMKIARTKIDVFKGTLTMEFDGEVIEFNISDAMRYPHDGHSCFSINVIDSWAQEFLDDLSEDALEKTFTQSVGLKNKGLALRHAHGNNKEHLSVPIQEELVEIVTALESNPRHIGKSPNLISIPNSTNKLLPSVIQPHSLELKPLPRHLKYEEDKLVRVLQEYRTAIRWTLADIKGISPTTYMHWILLEEGAKPSREAQRRLNPPMMDVVKKEIIKLLDYGVIYPISDSHWVSLSGVTVVKNEDNELVPTRIQTGWRVCIDYRKLNATTRKDHFPLPFIDQMLESYNQIVIPPDDQEKTTFTCPFGTFAYRRMPFGLCNAPATFQRCMDFIEDSSRISQKSPNPFAVYSKRK